MFTFQETATGYEYSMENDCPISNGTKQKLDC